MKTKKEMISEYKGRAVTGGAYAVRNTGSGKLFVDVTADLQGSRNRFDFSKQTGTCVYLKLQNDWKAQGGEVFAFEVLEELQKGETQSAAEFKADLDALKDLWLEKLADKEMY